MLWLTSFHIMAFAAWLAGMWYLPRLMVYHVAAAPGSEVSETFKVMERRLMRAITTPAMVVTLLTGLALASWGGLWAQGWLHVKLVLVLGMLTTHGLLAREVKALAADKRDRSGTYFRVVNEVPTVLFIGIVILAVVQPF